MTASVIAYFCGKIGFGISASTCDLIAWLLRGEGAYLMEPITAIVTALALGAAAGLKGTMEQLITDGYTALKMLIKRTFPRTSVSVDQLEQAPDSKARRAVVEEDLTQEGAAHNAEILTHTKALLDVIAQRVPHTAEIIGVSLKDITGASLRIADVLSSGSGVSVAGANIGGDLTIQGGPDRREDAPQTDNGSTPGGRCCRHGQLKRGLRRARCLCPGRYRAPG
jgi:hypothetical protein